MLPVRVANGKIFDRLRKNFFHSGSYPQRRRRPGLNCWDYVLKFGSFKTSTGCMDSKMILLVGGVGVLAYSTMRKAGGSRTLNFFPSGLKSLKMDGLTPTLSLGIMCQNPSDQSYTLRGFAGYLTANGYNIGNVSSFTPTIINRHSEVIYPVTVRLSLIGIVTDIINEIQTPGFSQEIIMNAYANVDGFNIPVKIKYKIP